MRSKSLIAIGLFALTLFIGAFAYLSNPAPLIAQNNTLESRVRALETAQAALLKRVAALEKPGATSTPVALSVATVAPAAGMKDDLGITYSINVPDELQVIQWTTYRNSNGQLEFVGEVALAPDALAFAEESYVLWNCISPANW